MSNNLVIVESASKCKTIEKIIKKSSLLNDKGTFKVIASSGHITDLPKKEIGIDTTTWKLKYETMKDKSKTIKTIKDLAKKADEVYLAADPDREGEAIAWHVNNILKAGNCKRITFNEITQSAIEEAITNPRNLDMPLVEAQESRRALDRIVGYKVSPLLWKNFPSNKYLSAGRVQSVALAEIINRYKEYDSFSKEYYWILEAIFKLGTKKIKTDLYKVSDKNIYKFYDEEHVLTMLEDLKNEYTWVFNYDKKTTFTNPLPPYTTSTLQQDAYNKYHMSSKETMSYIQKLYEKGYITYIRTDSVNISKDAKKMIHYYLRETFDNNMVYNRDFKNKVANAQEAHECIRPSKISTTSDKIEDEDLTSKHIKLYELIWKRTVASQMRPAEYITYNFVITNNSNLYEEYEFIGKQSMLINPGYLEIWQPNTKIQIEDVDSMDLKLKSKNKVMLNQVKVNGNITQPKCLYNEPRLIKWMETEGIGRPSTYSAILNKLFEKCYIYKSKPPVISADVNNYTLEKGVVTNSVKCITVSSKDKDNYIPTDLGTAVIEYIHNNIPSIIDKEFTSNMEEELDKISRNESSKETVLNAFYKPFEESISNAVIDKQNVSDKSSIKEFGDIKLISTKFGPALFIGSTKKYISITPYLNWKKISVEDIDKNDVEFITQLPKQYNDIQVALGRYGLYMIFKNKNYRLPKNEWENVKNNTIMYSQLKNYI